MNTNRDLDRILDVWLAEGPDHVPDLVFDNAVARLDRQPQTLRWVSIWRSRTMTPIARFTAAALLIVALTGAGLLLLDPASQIGPPGQAPTPTPSLSPTVAPTELPRLPASGSVSPGRYEIPVGPDSAVAFSFTLPPGWTASGGGLVKNSDDSERELAWGPAIVDTVYSDPCGGDATTPVGPAAADLVAALGTLPGLDVSAPLDITVGGYAAQTIELLLQPGVDVATCDPPIGLQVWFDRSGDFLLIDEGVPAIVVVADVPGGRFVLVSSRRETTPAPDLAELDAIFASIRFED